MQCIQFSAVLNVNKYLMLYFNGWYKFIYAVKACIIYARITCCMQNTVWMLNWKIKQVFMRMSKRIGSHIIELKVKSNYDSAGVWFYVFWTWNRWINLTAADWVCWFLDQWCCFGAFCWWICRLGAQSVFFFFVRKTSSWPCVWNYTQGSKRGRLTEKKTAVRQWITVLSWGMDEEAGLCQKTHTYSPARSYVLHVFILVYTKTLVTARQDFYYLSWTYA